LPESIFFLGRIVRDTNQVWMQVRRSPSWWAGSEIASKREGKGALVSPVDDRRKGRQRLLNKPESKCRLA
jgi:hypothetical protein